MIYYALIEEDKFIFSCVSRSKEMLEKRIDTAYWNWRGIQPAGTNPTKEEFLSDQIKVKVIIEQLKDKPRKLSPPITNSGS